MTPAQLQAYINFLGQLTPPGALNDAFFGGGLAPPSLSVVQSVPTIAALRAAPVPPNGTPIIVLGYNTAGDGPARIYVWSSSSTTADNGGSYIQITGQTTGRWILPEPDATGTIHLTDFGPVGQGSDDTAAMVAAVATGYNIQLPALTLNFNTATGPDIILIANNDQYIRGAGMAGNPAQSTLAGTVIQCNQSSKTIFHFQGANSCGVTNVTFNCPSMTDGWCVFLDNCSLCPIVEDIIFDNCPGLIAIGNASVNPFIRNIRTRGSAINGGTISLIDGSASTLRAAIYGFGTATQTGNTGPIVAENIVMGAGSSPANASIAVLLNGEVDSSVWKSLRINLFDIGVAIINGFNVGGGPPNHPNFSHFIDTQVQTPGCTLLDQAGYDIRSGQSTQFLGEVFCNASAGYGFWIGQNVNDVQVRGIRVNGCAQDCVFFQGNGLIIQGGVIQNAVNGSGNSGSANVHLGGASSNIIISDINSMGLKGGDTGYDVSINSGASNVIFENCAFTGGNQPTLINDPNFIAQYFPAIRQTFNPTVAFATAGDSSFTYTTQVGYIWQNGNFIEMEIQLTFNTNAYTTAAGALTIGGWPANLKTANNGAGSQQAYIGQLAKCTLSGAIAIGAAFVANGSKINLYGTTSAGAQVALGVTNFPASTTGIILNVHGKFQTS